jgi:TorA maturation chaperone TorD
MSTADERRITKVRLRLLDLAKSFFVEEPDAEKISRWRGTFSALAREKINPDFDKSVMEIHGFLGKKNLKELQEEYHRLFVDPFGKGQLNTSASFYLDGRSYGKTLAELRDFLAEIGLSKCKDVIESEDSLVVLLDILARLIDDEVQIESRISPTMQAKLLHTYLIPLSAGFSEACENNETADFYRTCGRFLGGYLELEKGLLGSYSPTQHGV